MNQKPWMTDRSWQAPRRPLLLPVMPERADDEDSLDTLFALLGKASAENNQRMVQIDVRIDEDLDLEL